MIALAARLRFWRQLLGRPGWVGAALLAAALVTYVALVMPAQRRLATLAQRESALRQEAAKRKDAPPEPPALDAQLAGFYKTFPAGGSTPDWLARIYDSALKQGLNLEQGEYSFVDDKGSRLTQYRITFPVKGSYPQVRRFIADVLATVPSASLEAVSFKREKIADGTVDARVAFLLFLEART